ncbi:MAG: sugar phosphate isomerase/epimerase [Armatimonadetes bacterium]|jgi:L-ribulose-5-phosphate 3-epimerase|nr:sugar phosphate isomerase/epimerase [Armatimonadota bacterium]
MKKGIVFDCVPTTKGTGTPLSAEDRLRLVKDAGFEGIEIPTMDDLGECERLAAQARDIGLEIHSVMASGHWQWPLSSPDEETRAKGVANIRQSVDTAKVSGADTVLVVPGVVNESTPYELAWDISLKSMRELAPYAEQQGICLAVENVWNKFLLSPREFLEFIDACQSSAVAAYFDVGNILFYGYPDQWIRSLGSKLQKIHLKDFDTASCTFKNLLQGNVPWTRVRQALLDVGYTGYCSVELGPYNVYPDQFIYDCARQVERIFNGE